VKAQEPFHAKVVDFGDRLGLQFASDATLSSDVRSRVDHAFNSLFSNGLNSRAEDSFPEFIQVCNEHSQPSIESIRNLGAFTGLDFPLGEVLGFWLEPSPNIPLYPFQRVGRDWLLEVRRGILADDMGLGKTVQAIAGIVDGLWALHFSQVLIVAPRSLAFNWYAEIGRWAPSLTVSLVVPGGANTAATWARRIGKSNVIITTYEQVRENYEIIQGRFDLIIADEAHRLRNISSGLSKAFSKLDSKYLWLLSGTPLERDVDDLLTLLGLLHPGRFSIRDRRLEPAVVRSQAQKYILRRLKSDVLQDLPALTVSHEFLELSEDQQQEYKRALVWKRGQNPLERYQHLRAICDVSSSGESSKIDRIMELLLDIRGMQESAVVFSFWDEPLQAMRARIETYEAIPLHFFHSGLSLLKRNAVVDRFRREGGVFLASGGIAAEGLTLVEANHVLFLNRWWNPSLNRQAADRIRRIGQEKPTYTYTFSAPGTIEIAIDDILAAKVEDEKTFVELLSKHLD
jgi:SNF2 family DNA or RNA helicase